MLSEMTFNIITRMVEGKRYYGENADFEEAKRFREIISEVFKLGGAAGNMVDFLPLSGWIGYGESWKIRLVFFKLTNVIIHINSNF